MSTPTPPSFPLPAPPPPASVIDDLPCRSCGYNLRTLPTDGICPECATPVAASLGGELLRHADPNWLSIVNTGCLWVQIGTYAAFIAWVLPVAFIRTCFPPLAAALIMAGTWQLTAPDPSGIGEKRYGPLRNWSRALAILLLPMSLITSFPTQSVAILLFFLRGAQLATLIVCGITLIGYLMGMATRLNNSQIRRNIRYRIFFFACSGVLLLAGWISRFMFAKVFFWKVFLMPLVPMFNLLFIIQALTIFRSALKEEIAAASRPTRPTPWRTAGAFLYWIKQLFRSTHGDNS